MKEHHHQTVRAVSNCSQWVTGCNGHQDDMDNTSPPCLEPVQFRSYELLTSAVSIWYFQSVACLHVKNTERIPWTNGEQTTVLPQKQSRNSLAEVYLHFLWKVRRERTGPREGSLSTQPSNSQGVPRGQAQEPPPCLPRCVSAGSWTIGRTGSAPAWGAGLLSPL